MDLARSREARAIRVAVSQTTEYIALGTGWEVVYNKEVRAFRRRR